MFRKRTCLHILVGAALLLGLYLTRLYSYLLFHSLAEAFSIIVACALFMLAWNSRRFLDNTYLLFIGLAYLFIGVLDLLHTLSYKGMGVFVGYGADLPTQLWISTRYLQSLTLIAAPFFIDRKLHFGVFFFVYSAVVGFLLVSIFYLDIFPPCFIDGTGLTVFKKTSEYVISLLFLTAVALLIKKRSAFDAQILRLLVASITITIASELAFTFYVDVYGISNLLGHFLKILAFYLIYKALIATSLTRPYSALFRNLKESEEALRESEEKYRSMMDGMVDPVYICGPDRRVNYMNPAMIVRAGGEFIGEPCHKVIHDQDEECPWCVFEKCRQGEHVVTEIVSPKDGRFFHITHTPLPHADGTVSKMTIFHDMTEQRRAEEDLREARNVLERRVQERTSELTRKNKQLQAEIEERQAAQEALRESRYQYEQLWDDAPVAYHLLNTKGIITRVNQTEEKMLGYSKEEMMGRPIFDFILADQREEARQRFVLKSAGHRIPKHENRVYVTKDGRQIYVAIDDVLERDKLGEVVGVRTTMVDITAQKHIEAALRDSEEELRRLSGQLLHVQEDERKRIARELHDSIGQSLAAVKFVAENALNQVRQGDPAGGVSTLESLIPLAQQAGDEVRRIHTDLRPSLIDDLGIVSTISWFCREFEKLYAGIHIEKAVKIEEKEVPEPLKIVIFRVLQEALNNVAKYGNAEFATVSLEKKDGSVELSVQDNGTGFDVARVHSEKLLSGGFGLTNMKERTELSGGKFSVESTLGAGTLVRAIWSLKA